MRSGGGVVQHALAADAAAVMRQAVSAARRRGHAQVTPLHVAGAALAGGGLLRAACLRSRSHPLQCKALELCLNVALSRLATAGRASAFGLQQQQQPRAPPALSNALAAAFKRAQASQRRGGGGSDGQQQHAKVELEQLVVSILDDPSVSRVMREAGFSSAEVKVNVEKAVISSEPPPSTNTCSASPNPPNTKGSKTDVAGDAAARVLDCMAASGGNRCVVVVGESAAAAEGVVKSVMDKVSKGEELELRHERLKNLQFVPISFTSFQRVPRQEADAGAGDLRALVRRGVAAGKGVVLVLEDLGLAADAWAIAAAAASRGRSHGYCPVEHLVMELSTQVRGYGDGEHDRFWLLAFGDYASYATCKAGQPSLESVLEMHPVVVPQGGLVASSLGGDSELTYCGTTDTVTAAPASVPSWLRRCRGPVPTGSELTLSFSSPAASSISGFTHCDVPNRSSNPSWHDLLPDQRQQLWLLNHQHDGPLADSRDHEQWPTSPTPGSSSSVSRSIWSGGTTEAAAARRRRPKFTELTAENLKVLCGALEARVPRHGGVAPGVASAVLQRRSGVTRRAAARRPSSAATWLLFQGPDGDGKAAVACELARLVFGSYDAFTTVVVAPSAEFTDPARSGSGSSGGGELGRRVKRPRSSPEKQDQPGYLQAFHDAIRENPHRVVLIDGVDRSDDEAGIIKSAIATGTVRASNGDVASLEDAIVVLSCEVFESWSRAPSPRRRSKQPGDIASKEDDDGTGRGWTQPRFCLDLNVSAIDGELEEGSSLDGVEILNAVDGVFSFQY